jgi:hypothetical protein
VEKNLAPRARLLLGLRPLKNFFSSVGTLPKSRTCAESVLSDEKPAPLGSFVRLFLNLFLGNWRRPDFNVRGLNARKACQIFKSD